MWKYSFRYSNILNLPRVRTSTYGKKSFKFAAASLCNSFPGHFRRENSIKINQNDMLKNIRTQNNKIKQRSYNYNKKLKAELNACGTVTFRAIPGLNQASELGEAVFPPAMIRLEYKCVYVSFIFQDGYKVVDIIDSIWKHS
jgi:hypothetical protein